MTQPLEFTTSARDGLALYTYLWRPSAEAMAVVVVTHGHGEYATKYTHVAEAFTAAGYALLAYDLRGHGRSGGPRGHVPRYAAYVSDLHRVMEGAAGQFPGKPLFVLGHSLGGQIVLAYLVERQPRLRGAILSAPWLRLMFQPPAWKVSLARTLANLAPSFAQETGLGEAVKMTHDEALIASYPDPALAHGWMSARLGMEAVARGEALFVRAPEVRTPVLILHGGEDGVFAAATSEAFFHEVAAEDKTLHIYPGLYHELLNEVTRAEVYADIFHWLEARLAPAAQAP